MQKMSRAERAVHHQVKDLLKEVNGIGVSKLESRNESGIKSIESGHKVSNKVHSHKSMENLRRELNNLGMHARKMGIKDISQINIDVVRSWIDNKEIGYRTASNYLSNINKLESHLDVTREQIRELRQEISPSLQRPQLRTRAYRNLDQIQVPDRSQPAFRLQRDYGLRPGAARDIRVIQNPVNIHKPDFTGTHVKGNILHYREKGGKPAQKTLDRETVRVIEENAQNGFYRIPRNTYARDLSKALKENGQEFNGAHGIRHTYAQESLQNGGTKQEVSLELGHKREEITNTYLR